MFLTKLQREDRIGYLNRLKGKLSVQTISTVSYTHLDVYKRQRKRLAVREFFKDSLYDVSPEIPRFDKLWNVGNWKYMSTAQQKDTLRRLRMMPLTDYEISKILEGVDVF